MRRWTIFKRCFPYNKKRWWKNVARIPDFIRELKFLLKHGYDSMLLYDFDLYFMDIMPEIIKHYRDNKQGYPMLVDNWPEPGTEDSLEGQVIIHKNEREWKARMDLLLKHLDGMDENSEKYDTPFWENNPEEKEREINICKDLFFLNLAKNFFYMWD